MVFLHGSGQDEQTLLNRRSDGQFIELAPYGRDKYRAYASSESQVYIVEAIDATAASFSIDRDKIIIAGFSMGAKVTSSWPEDKGHEYQDDRTNELYNEWLRDIKNE